jgi:flagellar assembly protein FliH
MQRVEKFLFDTSFDPRERNHAPAPPPEPTFSRSELEAARDTGRAEGHAAGEAAALDGIAAAGARAVAAVDGRLAELREQLVFVADQARRDGLTLAMAALRTLFPRLAAAHGLSEIETVVAECLELARHEPAIVFKFHPDVLEAATGPLEAMAAARAWPGKLVILADPKLTHDGCAVEWADGGAERNSPAVLEQIDQLVAQALDGDAGIRAGHQAGPQGLN